MDDHVNSSFAVRKARASDDVHFHDIPLVSNL